MRDIEDEVDWGDTPLEGSSAYDEGGFGCKVAGDDTKSHQGDGDETTDQPSPEFVLPRHLRKFPHLKAPSTHLQT